MWIQKPTEKTRCLFVAASGAEYMLTLNRIGLVQIEHPTQINERSDGFIETCDGKLFPSLDSFANEHGCIIVDFESTEICS